MGESLTYFEDILSISKIKKIARDWETAQCFKAFAALAENLDIASRTHEMAYY